MTAESPGEEVKPDDAVEPNQNADDAYDPVEEAGQESFPASDPPAWSTASKRNAPYVADMPKLASSSKART